jgi:D-alanyl-D-alanine endopeptidase (penicillin-binding protein 7)
VLLLLSFGIGFAHAEAGAATVRQAKKPASSKPPVSSKKTTATVKKPTAKRTRYSAAASRARRLKLARARAAARARAIREAAIPRFKTDSNGSVVPDLHAAAAIIYNPVTNEVLWEENSQNQRSIASITKVMTATIFVETEPDLEATVTVDRSDVRAASTTYLRANERLNVGDLLHLALIASDNAAARALARVSPWGSDGFVQRMNEKATELGLASTRYTDPSGLHADNLSSAYDMARLIVYAAGDDRISSVMRKPEYTFTTSRKTITIHSTNQLVRKGDVDILGGKTGFIARSGYCLVTVANLPDIDQQVAVVVLGARSNAGRFIETRNLFNWLSTKAKELFSKKDPE